MAVKTPDSREEQDAAYNPGDLHAAEQFPSAYATHGVDQAEAFANNPENASKNIDEAKSSEASSPWKTDYTGGKKKVTGKAFFKRKGAQTAVISIVTGGGLGIAGLISPAGALIHVKEIIQEKFNTMTSVIEDRSTIIMRNRIFSTVDTNATCKIKVKCSFKGLTKDEMTALRQSGADVLDADGKPITKNKLGRYTGGKTLLINYEDGTTEKIDAKGFKAAMRSNSRVRSTGKAVFSSAFGALQGAKSKLFRIKEKLTTSPDLGDGSDKDPQKETRKKISEVESGESTEVKAVPPSDSDYTDNKDGSRTLNGSETEGLDGFADDINKGGSELQEKAAAGEIVDPIPSDIAGAATMEESAVGTSMLDKAFGVLNPTSIVVGMCTTYKMANATAMLARTVAVIAAMRYASLFLSAADKEMAGDGTSNDVNQLMTILERNDEYGDAFGDATGYQYAAYGTVPDKEIASSAVGNAVIGALTAAVVWINHTFGKKNVKTACNILTNPVTQGVLSLTSFIPGEGAALGGLKTIVNKGAQDGAKALIDDVIKKIATKDLKGKLTKDALKTASKKASKLILKMAGGLAGIFVAKYLLDRYFKPYVERVAFNADLTGNEDGVKAMDTIANGFGSINQGTALDYGMMPLSKNEASAYMKLKKQTDDTYVADMRAQSNPFNVLDPYSASNSLASSLFTFSSKIKSSNLLSAPAQILSALNPATLLSANAGAVPVNDAGSCPDEYLNDQNLASTPFCNAIVAYNNLSKLENLEPDTNIDWMLNNKQIDEDGNAVPDSDYAKFEEKCGNAGGKVITELDDDKGEEDSSVLPKECYDSTYKDEKGQNFHLYDIDTNVNNDMDAKPPEDNSSNVKYIAAGNIPITGKDVGVSVFGGKHASGTTGPWIADWADNRGNDFGYGTAGHLAKGAKNCNDNDPHLTGTVSFAELDGGKALGDLPACTKLEIKPKGSDKTIIATKQDVGTGGDKVDGLVRSVDLWWESANALNFYDDTGVATIHVVDPATPETSLTTSAFRASKSSKNIGSLLNSVSKIGDFSIPSSSKTRAGV